MICSCAWGPVLPGHGRLEIALCVSVTYMRAGAAAAWAGGAKQVCAEKRRRAAAHPSEPQSQTAWRGRRATPRLA
jgi:hypothetical protein